MFRIWALVGALLFGGLVGGLLTYRPGAVAAGDPTERGTREICRAIVAHNEERWERLYRRYFGDDNVRSSDAPTLNEALRTARTLANLFHPDDPVGKPRRTADGTSGSRTLRAVECPIGTGDRARIVTIHWQREAGERWRPYSVVVSASTAGEGVVIGGDMDAHEQPTEADSEEATGTDESNAGNGAPQVGSSEDPFTREHARAEVEAEVERSERRPAEVAAEVERAERGY